MTFKKENKFGEVSKMNLTPKKPKKGKKSLKPNDKKESKYGIYKYLEEE